MYSVQKPIDDKPQEPLVATEEIKVPNPSLPFIFKLISFWVGYNMVNAALTSIVWPIQIESIVGENEKELYNGIIPAASALVSLIVTPLAGLWSDWSTSSYGRRRPFVLTGTLLGAAALLACGYDKHSIFALLGLLFVLQLGINAAAGPYAGLLPDVVEKSRVGKASGYLSFANAIGNMVGVVCAGVIMDKTSGFWPIYIFLTSCLLVFMIPTLFVKETPNRVELGTSSIKELAHLAGKAFYLPWTIYKNLYWVIISRFLEEMGVSAILPFFLYFLEDIIQVGDAKIMTSVSVAVTMLCGVPTAIYAGHISDKYGRKVVVYLSVGLMSLTSISLVLVTIYPNIYLFLISSGFFGVGYGAYRAVDWALAIDVLPPESQIAKDMGVWHISLVLPRVLSPLISGVILDKTSDGPHTKNIMGYIIVYSVSIAWFLSSIFFVTFIKTAHETQKQLEIRQKLTASLSSSSSSIESENNVLLRSA